jgi:hypothetical protein
VTSPRVRTITSAEELLQLRPLWEAMCAAGHYTIFQDFNLNLLAARMFAGREQPFIVCAEASYGSAIIPTVVRHADNSLRLLGDELFDYRCLLHRGDRQILRVALAALAGSGLPLEIVAVRESETAALPKQLPLELFCSAPGITRQETSAEGFASAHLRLSRNLRRLAMLRFKFHSYAGDYPGLLRFIYEKKAEQNSGSLFYDPLRIEFMVEAAKMLPDAFEIFTFEDESSIVAAVVTLRERDCRRFYTGWFAPELEKHSPALSLIYEVTRQSLEQGLDCDYMTGEQLYKLRLATSSVQLYRVKATSAELGALAPVPADSTAV